jgi:hypothetical protein
MKNIFLILLLLLEIFPAFAISANAQSQSLQCATGPVNKTYGDTPWLVYSCNDNRTLVIVSAPGNPASPFYFSFTPQEDGYHIQAAGNGRKDVTAAVLKELKALSDSDIAALIEQTKQH